MENKKHAAVAILLLLAAILPGLPLESPRTARAATNLSLQLFLNVPEVAYPGQTIAVELWTVYNGDTLAFNATGTGTPCVTLFPCISFNVASNLGIKVPPHVHTPSGGFVPLPPLKTWVHPGAWNTSYVVPAETGLYGVHLYANYTLSPGNSAVNEAATTFTVVNSQNSLFQLSLHASDPVNPGQTVAVELWTVYNGDTLAFNATGTGTPCVILFPCISFNVKTNLGITVPPHVHTPGGSFVPLPALKTWVHPGAWNTSYVPSQLGFYGVHVYANYTLSPGVSYVNQAATSFFVQPAPSPAPTPPTPASPSDVANVNSAVGNLQNLVYGVLGVAILAVVLDLAILMKKRTSA